MTRKKSQIRRLRKLRENGLSVRQIAQREQVPPTTVHHHVRDVKVKGHHPTEPIKPDSKTEHGFRKTPERYISIKTRGRLYGGLLIHLPDLVTCPVCGDQSNDIILCFECGKIWIADCDHGSELEGDSHKGVDLGELRRAEGNGELHVFPVVFRKRED